MNTDSNLNDRILVSSQNTETSEFVKIIVKKNTKGMKYKPSRKKGKLCGSKHPSICKESMDNFVAGLLLNYKRRDPFFMVDGVVTEEQEIDPVNTNSGVLYEDELVYLQ
jgi:hypothetical protein